MNYLVLLEIILCSVYAVEILKIDTVYTNLYWLAALVYACLKLVFYILYDNKINKNLSVATLIFVSVLTWFFYPFVLFFPLCLNQTNIFTLKKGWGISFVSLLWLFIIPSDYVIIFLLGFGFSTILVYMQKEQSDQIILYEEKLEALLKKQAKMKEQIETFSQVTENITYQSQLEERNKLSQALHDEMGHTLSGNILRLEAIKLVIEKNTQRSKTMLQEVIDNLRKGMDSIRSILKAVKPEISTVNIANLKLVIDNVKKQSGINIHLKYNSDVDVINQSMWQAIMPNIKEALTNMMKYSKADSCQIEFIKLNKLYRVTVKDNGVGCSSMIKGLGMAGIEERMTLIDGNAIFDSSSGFSVTMIFPI